MDIQALHLENNAYRDMIKTMKDQINRYDRLIQANETEIGRQLGDMDAIDKSYPHDCTLCLGNCNE